MAQQDKPYDHFFQSIFSRPALAWELTLIAAPEIAAEFSAPEILVKRESLVDPEFLSHQTDLLIRLAQQEDEAFVYVLYEHKSTPYRFVSLQLLRYMGVIWDRSREDRSDGQLPQIIPIVIYHGRPSWQPFEFSQLVSGPGGDHVPRFTPRFVNLADVAPERITGSLGFVVALLGLKYVRQRLTEANATLLAAALDAALADPAAREFAQQVERLYVKVRSHADIRLIATAAANREYTRAEEGLMTFAEELLQEGLQKGRQEGRQEGELHEKRSVLLRLLSRKFTITSDERARVLSCDNPAALDAALDEIITADEKEFVLDKLL